NLNPYYLQTLCMLFFPGVKFPENEEMTPETHVVTVDMTETETGVSAVSAIVLGEKRTEGRWSENWNAEIGDRDRIRKIAAGRAFMLAGEAFTGFTPPWGIMTGVRPAKLVSEYLHAGKTPREAAALLEREFFASPEKASLAVQVAQAEDRLITAEKRKECSLYIAIPFCPTRCAYCSFVSYTSPNLLKLIPEYLAALAEDIDHTCALIQRLGLHVATVYIGGGTPTILTAGQLDFLLSRIRKWIPEVEEFTLEAGRPDTITRDKLETAKRYGVDRISVNTQTLNENVLERIGRKHTAAEFFAAYETAREVGIRAVNIDLIAGLPADTAGSFRNTIDAILPLQAENVTVHTFCVKKSADFKTEGMFDRDGMEAMKSVAYSYAALTEHGYLPYYMYRQKNTVGNLENVGYARAGYEGLYNIYMMEEVHSIFSCGASAVTKFVSLPEKDGSVRIERIFQPKYPYEYLREQAEGDRKRQMDLERAAEQFYGL
ncbi:MAG: coproporphyrinogen dehydrogenase HemZ, partial [Clostridia bacterium]|nr:coproporphyrinogen dehydrogenase HemZ [Clostridia bacterium]